MLFSFFLLLVKVFLPFAGRLFPCLAHTALDLFLTFTVLLRLFFECLTQTVRIVVSHTHDPNFV